MFLPLEAGLILIIIHIPTWLERMLIRPILLYRLLRYGYPFRRIPLTKGKFTIVDPEDFERLNRYKWHLTKNTHTFYAKRNAPTRKNTTPIYMHRRILKVPTGCVVDHINHNGLDNRKANLRPATRAQNNRHTKKVNRKSRSKYKGLYFHRRDKVWYVRITTNGKTIHLGSFKDEVEAARAYDKAAQKHHGQFAGLNFPDE